MTTVFAARATMVDGSQVDLLLFDTREAAEEHLQYVQTHCNLLGYDRIVVVERRVIGKDEPVERRAVKRTSVRTAIQCVAVGALLLLCTGCGDVMMAPTSTIEPPYTGPPGSTVPWVITDPPIHEKL